MSAAYDFSRSCAGDYSIEPSRRFTYVDADGTPRDLYATIEDIAKVKLSGNLATPWHVHEKRTVWLGCSSKEKAMIRAAYTKAKEYATEAAGYLEGISAGTNRYETWFGAYHPVRKAIVQEHFEKVRDSRFRKYTFDCIACKDTIDFARVGMYIFRWWDCYSVTNNLPDQSTKTPERSSSALPSGTWNLPVSCPRLERLFTRLPTIL